MSDKSDIVEFKNNPKTKQIDVSDGIVYALVNDGRVYRIRSPSVDLSDREWHELPMLETTTTVEIQKFGDDH